MSISLFVRGKLANPLNVRQHWAARHRTTDYWRVATRIAWIEAGRPRLTGGGLFKFTAYTGKLWDANEGIHAACKPCRDEVIYCLTGSRDDGPESGHVFTYVNEVRAAGRGVLIEVTEHTA